MDALSQFLRREAARRYSWDSAHCLMMAADWMVERGWPDPASMWRDVVRTEAAALALLKAEGGVAGLMRRAMVSVSAPCTTNPVCRGDVGLVIVGTPDGPGEAAGICTGSRWAVRGPRGLWVGRAETLSVWRV